MNTIKESLKKEFPFLCAAPALLWQLYFLYIPLIGLFLFSFIDFSQAFPTVTFRDYAHICNEIYGTIILNSFFLAVTTACICLLIGYPLAYFIALKAGRFKTLLLFLLIMPSWTSFIVQVYAWFFLLGRRGVFTEFLSLVGLLQGSSHLLNTYFSVLLGMVYCFLPFMIFPLYTVLERVDEALLQASADLGATRFETFKRVIVPLSMPGIAVGLLLVFIPAFAEFVIPEILGGFRYTYVGNVIAEKYTVYNAWSSAAAFMFMALIFPGILLFVVFSGYTKLKKFFYRIRRASLEKAGKV